MVSQGRVKVARAWSVRQLTDSRFQGRKLASASARGGGEYGHMGMCPYLQSSGSREPPLTHFRTWGYDESRARFIVALPRFSTAGGSGKSFMNEAEPLMRRGAGS